MQNSLLFIDCEVHAKSGKVIEIGAIGPAGQVYRGISPGGLASLAGASSFLCGHNIFAHDLPHVQTLLDSNPQLQIIDSLLLSALLHPTRLSHALPKEEKTSPDTPNDPVADAKKCQALFGELTCQLFASDPDWQQLLSLLLGSHAGFQGFFSYYRPFLPTPPQTPPQTPDPEWTAKQIQQYFHGRLCGQAPLKAYVQNCPLELAFCLSKIEAGQMDAPFSPWIQNAHPQAETVLHSLRLQPCGDRSCAYCHKGLDALRGLQKFFGFPSFRSYDGEPLQERAARAALEGRSLLAIFPTGGGKSLAFQVPALLAGEAMGALTVVISPLQSLMKDQVDNLAERGIYSAATLNGMQDPLERADSLRRLQDGQAHLLYIAPESLRSHTLERILLRRHVARFVIDEAHCFSAWGQDFRVDYLYIADFIKNYIP